MDTMRPKSIGELRVADVMTSPAVTIEAAASLWDAVERFFLSGLHHLVVVTNGRCVGVIDDRQVAAQWPARAISLRSSPVAKMLDGRQPHTVAAAPVLEAAQTMLSHRVDALPVIDDARRIVGILTGSDLIRLLVASAQVEALRS
jgi:CBS domain-containing protein